MVSWGFFFAGLGFGFGGGGFDFLAPFLSFGLTLFFQHDAHISCQEVSFYITIVHL